MLITGQKDTKQTLKDIFILPKYEFFNKNTNRYKKAYFVHFGFAIFVL